MNEQDIRIEARNWCGAIDTDRGCSENQAENLAIHFFGEGRKKQNEVWIKFVKDKIKELKKRKKNLIHQTSVYAMQMTIETLEELI